MCQFGQWECKSQEQLCGHKFKLLLSTNLGVHILTVKATQIFLYLILTFTLLGWYVNFCALLIKNEHHFNRKVKIMKSMTCTKKNRDYAVNFLVA